MKSSSCAQHVNLCYNMLLLKKFSY